VRWREPKRRGSALAPETFGKAIRTGLRTCSTNAHLRATLIRTLGFFVLRAPTGVCLPPSRVDAIAATFRRFTGCCWRHRRRCRRGSISCSGRSGKIWVRTEFSPRPPSRPAAATGCLRMAHPARDERSQQVSWPALPGSPACRSLNVSRKWRCPEWVRDAVSQCY